MFSSNQLHISLFLSTVTIVVVSTLPATSSACQDDKKSDSGQFASAEKAPKDATGETEIKLDRRTNSEYGKSAYSFRYKTQSKAKHKNYVDLVYSANGNLRISNHGGMESKIVDLGTEVGNGFNIRKVKDGWQKMQIKPVTGHYYAYHVKVQNYQMTVVFRVDQLTEEQVGITAWYQKGKNRWPALAANRGAAGTSGMSGGRRTAR